MNSALLLLFGESQGLSANTCSAYSGSSWGWMGVWKKTPLKKNNHNHHDEMEWLSKRAQEPPLWAKVAVVDSPKINSFSWTLTGRSCLFLRLSHILLAVADHSHSGKCLNLAGFLMSCVWPRRFLATSSSPSRRHNYIRNTAQSNQGNNQFEFWILGYHIQGLNKNTVLQSKLLNTRGAKPPTWVSLCDISRKINRGIHLAGTHFKKKGCLILGPNSNSVGTLFALYLWNQLIYHFEHLTVQSSYFCAIHILISAF